MSKASGTLYIPQFGSIRLIECRDYITLAAVPSYREFFAYGKVKASEATIDLEDGTTEPFWDNCTPSEEVWAVVQWVRFEDGYEEKGSIHYLRSPKTEEDARKAMEDMSAFYNLSKAELMGGSSTFTADDFKDLATLIDRLMRHYDLVSTFVWQSLSNSEQMTLRNYQPLPPGAKPAQDVVVKALNRIIGGPCIYELERFKGIALWPRIADLVKQNPTGPDLAHLNRLLLDDAYPRELCRQVVGLVQCFAATDDDYAYIESRYPNYQSPPSDPTALDELDVYQARLKMLAGLHPKTVELMKRADETQDPQKRKELQRETVKAYYAELAHFWTEDEVLAWQRTNPIGTEWMCEFVHVFEEPEKVIDPIKYELAFNWLRRKYNLLTAEELSDAVLKATLQRVMPGTLKKIRERLGLTTNRSPGPKPNPNQ